MRQWRAGDDRNTLLYIVTEGQALEMNHSNTSQTWIPTMTRIRLSPINLRRTSRFLDGGFQNLVPHFTKKVNAGIVRELIIQDWLRPRDFLR